MRVMHCMNIKLLYMLTEDITSTLTLKLSVGQEMQRQAARNGYGPDELQNLLSQKTQEVAQKVAEALGIDYDSEPD